MVNSKKSTHFSILSPDHGYAGEYTKFSETTCKSTFINGVAIEIYKNGGTLSDARGATNLQMYCKDGTKLKASNDDTRCNP